MRHRYIAGRATLRAILATILECAPECVPLERGKRGRPQVARCDGVDFNVSHTGGVALIAISALAASVVQIGVDVESITRQVNADRLATKFLSTPEIRSQSVLPPDERRIAFLRYWTYKEALAKATGEGLIAPFRKLVVDLGSSRLLAGPAPYSPDAWTLCAVAVPNGYVAALAIWRRGAPVDEPVALA